MSMNIHAWAKCTCGCEMHKSIPLWQTPTEVSYKIINSGDPFKAYCEWAKDEDHISDIKKEMDRYKDNPNVTIEWAVL